MHMNIQDIPMYKAISYLYGGWHRSREQIMTLVAIVTTNDIDDDAYDDDGSDNFDNVKNNMVALENV